MLVYWDNGWGPQNNAIQTSPLVAQLGFHDGLVFLTCFVLINLFLVVFWVQEPQWQRSQLAIWHDEHRIRFGIHLIIFLKLMEHDGDVLKVRAVVDFVVAQRSGCGKDKNVDPRLWMRPTWRVKVVRNLCHNLPTGKKLGKNTINIAISLWLGGLYPSRILVKLSS